MHVNRREFFFASAAAAAAQQRRATLKVSANRRYLSYSDGRPFFYLGDTAWELFHRLNREEAERYLTVRASQGFTVIQAVVLAELDGLGTPNANGDLPLRDRDITKPQEAYFKHVDFIVEKAASLGLFTGMLPTWGDKVGVAPGSVIQEHNARQYGRFLGARYREKPIIWILGGDRAAEGNVEIWNEMAAGLREGDGGSHLMTYHPMGGMHSSTWFHYEDWLDFNMLQSGHSPTNTNYRMIQQDYAIRPPKPCMDGEPSYEYPPDDMPPARPIGAVHVRRNAYWAVFAGAHGHTYGTHPVWQMYDPPRKPLWDVNTPWHKALELPGALQMRHLKQLMLSRPFFTRIPDQRLLRSGVRYGLGYVAATRDGDAGSKAATYIMCYFPEYQAVQLDTRPLGPALRGWWFNPRNGKPGEPFMVQNGGTYAAEPPTRASGEDWVLVIDDAARNYGPPGATPVTG